MAAHVSTIKSACTENVSVDTLATAFENLKDCPKGERVNYYNALTQICTGVSAKNAEPFLVTAIESLLKDGCGKKASKPEAEAASAAMNAIMKMISPFSLKTLLPILFSCSEKTQFFRVREMALNSISFLATSSPESMAEELFTVWPELEHHVHDMKPQVKDAARAAVSACSLVVNNPDIDNVVGDLVNAMADPQQVVPVIHKLAGTTFVRSVATPTLVVLVPLLLRGLNEGSTAVKRYTAKIISNMSKLVDQPLHAEPFLPSLLPAIRKAADGVSDPDARSVCEDVLAQMEKLEASCETAKPENKVSTTQAAEIISKTSSVNAAALPYIASVVSSMVDVKSLEVSTWEEAIGAFMSKEAVEKVHSECSRLLTLVEDVEEEEDDAEELCNCEFTLAYGNKILLHNTKMKLQRGKKYGLLGANDSGKTTLMRSIANEQVEGFPDSSQVKTVFVEADIKADLSDLTCTEYVMADERLRAGGITVEVVAEQLLKVGFTQKMLHDCVSTLSGGWRMKLALARAMLQNADILLLDEPTNHLDVINVKWVKNYLLGLKDVTCIMVSHDTGLLNDVCTNILQIDNLRLHQHKGNLSAFVEKVPSAKSYFELRAKDDKKFHFPQPGRIEGVKKKGRALMKMDDVTFRYPINPKPTVYNVTVQVSMASRVACVGVNGAGKSTIIKLLTAELEPTTGTVWKHPNSRMAYVAQHAFHHIEKHLDKTPNQYIQWRYQTGEDKESLDKVTMQLTPEEEKKCEESFEWTWKDEETGKIHKDKRAIEYLTGARRTVKDGSKEYDTKWVGMDITKNTFVSDSKLKELGFLKHMAAVDAKVAANSGRLIRPLTTGNVEKHLEDVGLDKEFGTHTLLGALSGGQKVKVVLAAAMWNQPHILILDEPTNYLDREALGMLSGAIETWEGGVVMITHNNEFCEKLCPEVWLMENGRLDLQGDPEWMANAANAAAEAGAEITEMIDGAGNVITAGKGPKKELNRKEKKILQKRIKAKEAAGEDLTESEDEFLMAEAGL